MRNVPKWAKGNAFAKRFFKWLRKKNNPALLTGDAVFTKVSVEVYFCIWDQTWKIELVTYIRAWILSDFLTRRLLNLQMLHILCVLKQISQKGKIPLSNVVVCIVWNTSSGVCTKKLEKENKEISITAMRAAVAWKYRELIEQACGDDSKNICGRPADSHNRNLHLMEKRMCSITGCIFVI